MRHVFSPLVNIAVFVIFTFFLWFDVKQNICFIFLFDIIDTKYKHMRAILYKAKTSGMLDYLRGG